MISLLRKIIPDGVRMPAFIVIVASFVTMVQFLMQGYLPSLYDSLGIYIPLIVVNCIILGRAEAYASKNPVLPSAFDGLGMGLGFTCAITILGAVRELIGAGTILSTGSSALVTIPESVYTPASIFILAPGAFFVLAGLTALQNKLRAQGLPWEISKAFDNSAVIGTFIPLEQAGDVNRLPFHLDINGSKVQEGNTSNMLFSVDKIIAYVSRFFTLKIGDLIYTGTPAGVGPVKIDDHLEGYLGERKLLDFYVR